MILGIVVVGIGIHDHRRRMEVADNLRAFGDALRAYDERMTSLYQAVQTAEEFDRRFQEDSVIAESATTNEQATYERLDAKLAALIKKACDKRLHEDSQKYVRQVDGQAGAHTRRIQVAVAGLSRYFTHDLHRLLTDDLESWRIRVDVHRNLDEDAEEIGSLVIYSDRIIVEQAVLDEVDLRRSSDAAAKLRGAATSSGAKHPDRDASD